MFLPCRTLLVALALCIAGTVQAATIDVFRVYSPEDRGESGGNPSYVVRIVFTDAELELLENGGRIEAEVLTSGNPGTVWSTLDLSAEMILAGLRGNRYLERREFSSDPGTSVDEGAQYAGRPQFQIRIFPNQTPNDVPRRFIVAETPIPAPLVLLGSVLMLGGLVSARRSRAASGKSADGRRSARLPLF